MHTSRPPRAFVLTAALVLLAGSFPLTAGPASKPYDAIDRHALKAPPDVEASVQSLARFLVEPATNDKEKVRAIYRWITDRIAYDTESFFAHQHPDESPEQTLKRRKALCGGYALLFKALCKEAGVKAVVVQGKVKGIGYVESDPSSAGLHGWNAVKLGEDWYLVDATRGAGSINEKSKKFEKSFREFYFLTPPEALIFTHFPRKENCQLLDEPLAEKDFDRQPKASARFFEVGVTPAALRKTIAAADFAGLVKIYDSPNGRSFLLKEAPLSATLKAGSRYQFLLETVDFHAVVVSSGGRTFALTRAGKQCKGTIIAPRGKIKVQGAVGEPGKIILWDLLEYEGK